MKRTLLVTATLVFVFAGGAWAGDALIKSAMSAAPKSISAGATIMDWDFKVIREGNNGWTCLPDRADTPGIDPLCVNEPWMNFLRAYVKKEAPTYTGFGIAYMMKGDTPVSNTDPFATKPTDPEDWVTELGPHLMILVPDKSILKAFPKDHLNGGPWVMWPDTPYAHIMIPLESRGMMTDKGMERGMDKGMERDMDKGMERDMEEKMQKGMDKGTGRY